MGAVGSSGRLGMDGEMAGGGAHDTYQEEGAHSGDLVELHQQPQGLLVVATVLLVHTELVLL